MTGAFAVLSVFMTVVTFGASWTWIGIGVSTVVTGFLLHLAREAWRDWRVVRSPWVRLDTRFAGRYRYLIDRGELSGEAVDAKSGETSGATGSYSPLALSADGTLIAAVTGRELKVWAVSARTGAFRLWWKSRSVHGLAARDLASSRVLAVRRRGGTALWVALAWGDELLIISGLVNETLSVVHRCDGLSGTGSCAFLRSAVAFVSRNQLYERSLATWADKPSLSHELERTDSVICLDVANVGGRATSAMLVERDGQRRAIVVTRGAASGAYAIPGASYLSLVRRPEIQGTWRLHYHADGAIKTLDASTVVPTSTGAGVGTEVPVRGQAR